MAIVRKGRARRYSDFILDFLSDDATEAAGAVPVRDRGADEVQGRVDHGGSRFCSCFVPAAVAAVAAVAAADAAASAAAAATPL